MLHVRKCKTSNRKPWLVRRDGFEYPIYATYSQADAMRYALKTISLWK